MHAGSKYTHLHTHSCPVSVSHMHAHTHTHTHTHTHVCLRLCCHSSSRLLLLCPLLRALILFPSPVSSDPLWCCCLVVLSSLSLRLSLSLSVCLSLFLTLSLSLSLSSPYLFTHLSLSESLCLSSSLSDYTGTPGATRHSAFLISVFLFRHLISPLCLCALSSNLPLCLFRCKFPSHVAFIFLSEMFYYFFLPVSSYIPFYILFPLPTVCVLLKGTQSEPTFCGAVSVPLLSALDVVFSFTSCQTFLKIPIMDQSVSRYSENDPMLPWTAEVMTDIFN